MRRLYVGFAVLAVLATGCSATRLTSVWKAPEFTSPPNFQKLLVMYVSREVAQRRAAEERLVSLIGSQKATASYTVIPEDEVRDVEKAKVRVKAGGFDGVVAMRAVDVNQQTTYVPGTTYGSYYASPWGYYGRGWGHAYDPGYVRTDTIYQIETLVYDVAKEKLLWASRSETVSPSSIEKMVEEVAVAVADRMRTEGLVR